MLFYSVPFTFPRFPFFSHFSYFFFSVKRPLVALQSDASPGLGRMILNSDPLLQGQAQPIVESACEIRLTVDLPCARA